MSTINVDQHCYMHGFANPCPICEGNRRMTQTAVDAGREQRRYEIARDVMAAKYAGGWIPNDLQECAWNAVRAADALLKALEESSDGE